MNNWIKMRYARESPSAVRSIHSTMLLALAVILLDVSARPQSVASGLNSLPSRRDPGRRFGQEANAGPTEFSLWMGRRGGHHSGNVRRGRSHVCCVDCRISLPWNRTLAGYPRPAF
jgi:hypothetical protein